MNETPIKLYQFQERAGVPSASPFCAKLELWLKITGIPYESERVTMTNKAPKKKIPYVVIDGKAMGDSTLIINHLAQSRGISLDDGLTPIETARDQALQGMLEERLYWYMVYDRWLGDGWPFMSEKAFGHMSTPFRQIVKAIALRAVRRMLWVQGTARHTPGEIQSMAERDIAALAEIVGDGPYVHGAQMRAIDAVVYAFVYNLTLIKMDTPMIRAARTHANLVAYAERITREYFPEVA